MKSLHLKKSISLILILVLVLVASSVCAFADGTLGTYSFYTYYSSAYLNATSIKRWDESSHTFTVSTHTASDRTDSYKLLISFPNFSLNDKPTMKVSAEMTFTDFNGDVHDISVVNASPQSGWATETFSGGGRVGLNHTPNSDGNYLAFEFLVPYSTFENRAECTLKLNSLTIDGVDYITAPDYIPYWLDVPKGYALCVDDSYAYRGDLHFWYYSVGNTENVSLSNFPLFYTGSSMAGTVLSSSNMASVESLGYSSTWDYTVYEGALSLYDDGKCLIVPALSVLSVDGSGTQRPLANANLYKRLVVGGYMSDVPFEAISLVPITQSHTGFNYVSFDTTKAIRAVVNPNSTSEEDFIIWETSVTDNIPSDDDIIHDGASGFWDGLKDLFSSGSDILNGLVQSASGFLSAFASMFSWLPEGFTNLFYSALVVILIVGIIKVFL